MRAYRKTLTNGVRAIVVAMPESPTVTTQVWVGTGSHFENKKENGLSHFLEHMMFKGTSRRPSALAIAHELDSLGAENNAFTSGEYTSYYAKARNQHFKKILDVIADIAQNPLFEESEIEKEKGVIIEEINMYEDIPRVYVGEVFDRLLYGDQPAGRSILGSKENIRRFTRDDFLAYRDTHYTAGNTVVVVAGDIKPAEAFAEVERQFADLPRGAKSKKPAVKPHHPRSRVLAEHKKTDQTHFVLGCNSFSVHDRHNNPARMLAGVLRAGMSSRLFQKLREEMGVCYYVDANQSGGSGGGVFYIASGVDTKRLEEVLVVIMEELTRLTDELVPERELDKVKEYRAATLAMGLESSDDVADFFGRQAMLGFANPKPPREVVRELKAVSAGRVRAVARNLFAANNLRLALVGPAQHAEVSKLARILRK